MKRYKIDLEYVTVFDKEISEEYNNSRFYDYYEEGTVARCDVAKYILIKAGLPATDMTCSREIVKMSDYTYRNVSKVSIMERGDGGDEITVEPRYTDEDLAMLALKGEQGKLRVVKVTEIA